LRLTKNIEDILRMGVINLFPCQGRCMVFMYPKALDRSRYTIPLFLQAFWYAAHAALENECTARYGFVVIGFPDNLSPKQWDFPLARACAESVRGALPMRVSGYHICNPAHFTAALWPVCRLILGERLRKRFILHYGSREKTLECLEQTFGFERAQLPLPIGGEQEIDFKRWLEERRILEASVHADFLACQNQ
jgi:hypothetical protein